VIEVGQMLFETKGIRARKRQSRKAKPESREEIYINQWTPSKLSSSRACVNRMNVQDLKDQP